MAYLTVKPALEPELCIDVSAEQASLMLRAIGGDTTPYRRYKDRKEDTKAAMRKNLPHVKSLDILGVYLEFIYGDMPAPHAPHFPEDIRGLGFTDEKIRELFPDMDDLIPGNWSSHGYTHGKFELGLYLEPEGSRLPDWYGPYTLQMFFADDDIVCISAR